MEPRQVAAAVKRGAALLDEYAPHWWKKVKVPIEMASVDLCVLGQVSGDFVAGQADLLCDAVRGALKSGALGNIRLAGGSRLSDAIAYNLDIDASYYGFDSDSSDDETYDRLAQLWAGVIEDRKQMAKKKKMPPPFGKKKGKKKASPKGAKGTKVPAGTKPPKKMTKGSKKG